MDLPSPREIELEIAMRQRDAQVAELTDEITRLRHYLSVQPGPSTVDPVTLPPALISILLPYINDAASGKANATSGSTTVNTALTQRVKVLQEENDELYDLLKHTETGRLKEEVRGLTRMVEKLEGSLRESHQAISSLSAELEKSYESFLSTKRPKSAHSQSPSASRNSYHSTSHAPSTSNGTSKLPPTGPRAYKKPRLSDTRTASPSRSHLSPQPPKAQGYANNSQRSLSRHRERSRSPRAQSSESRPRAPSNMKMEVDEDSRQSRMRSSAGGDRESENDRDRNWSRARDRGVERERDRMREPDRLSRRNGGHGGGGRRARGFAGHPYVGMDRTLKERMGM